ncbi:MAG TPA: hypothetical protein VMV72_18125 [Verrucomicrobiae bacterium]|nr:hypothetical protein [Verrucomicrobiae bacterium]
MDWLDINSLKRKRHSSVLALSLDGGRLDGVVLRRTNGSLRALQSFSEALSLDPLTADGELVGREIRNHLDAAGVRERACVVCLPLKWALVVHVELPELPEADVASFLQIEAERGFPCDVATLRLATSRWRSTSGRQHATLVGVPENHLAALERALQAAHLKPVSFSIGITALQPPGGGPSDGVLALAIGEDGIDLQINCGGGVGALRSLEGALEIEGSHKLLHPDAVAREARITLGQLPSEFRETVRSVRVFGPAELARELANEVEGLLATIRLSTELVDTYPAGAFGVELPAGAKVSRAFSLGALYLTRHEAPLEFLRPKIAPWQQLAQRYSSSRIRMAGATAGAVALLVLGLFLIQQWQLMRLRSRWRAMSSKVTELNGLQDQIRQYRPWFDRSFPCLSVLRELTLAFPEDGAVSAKTVEIRDVNTVTCSGTARDNAALLKTLTQLRGTSGVNSLKVDQIRGKAPMQFTFDLQWGQGGASAN